MKIRSTYNKYNNPDTTTYILVGFVLLVVLLGALRIVLI